MESLSAWGLRDILIVADASTCRPHLLHWQGRYAVVRIRLAHHAAGSTNVGRIVAAAAAKQLTPTTLELGSCDFDEAYRLLTESDRRRKVARIRRR